MLFVEVALKVPLHRNFDYKIDPNITVQKGCRVWVTFANRKLVAMVVDIKTQSDVPDNKIKAITSVIDERPIISDAYLTFLKFTARYYCHSLGETIFTALPASLRQGEHPDKTQVPDYTLTEEGKASLMSVRIISSSCLVTKLRSALLIRSAT